MSAGLDGALASVRSPQDDAYPQRPTRGSITLWKASNVSSEAVTYSIIFAVVGVLLTLQVTLELTGLTHFTPFHFGLLLLMLGTFIVAATILSVLPVKGAQTVGEILILRILDSGKNWEREPLRSFLELFLCASAVWQSLLSTGDLATSLVCGTLSSWAVVLAGELATEPLRTVEAALAKTYGDAEPQVDDKHGPGRRMGCSITLLALYAWGGVQLIYAHVRDLLWASGLAAFMCLGTLLLAKLCTACKPVRRVGELIQDRLVLNVASNWQKQPLRCAIELCLSLGAALFAHGAVGRGASAGETSHVLLAAQAGVLSGVITCLVCEAAFEGRVFEGRSEAAAACELMPLAAEPSRVMQPIVTTTDRESPWNCVLCCLPKGIVGAASHHNATIELAGDGEVGGEVNSEEAPSHLSPSSIDPSLGGAQLQPPAYTSAVRTELLSPAMLPSPIAFPILRVRTTGVVCTQADLTPTLAFMGSALHRGEALATLFDLRDTGAELRPPPFSLLRQAIGWANSHAKEWDTHVQCIAVLLSLSGAAKPLLNLAIRMLNPPQPIVVCNDEGEALAFLARHQTARSRTVR